jgi:hypothetical protein
MAVTAPSAPRCSVSTRLAAGALRAQRCGEKAQSWSGTAQIRNLGSAWAEEWRRSEQWGEAEQVESDFYSARVLGTRGENGSFSNLRPMLDLSKAADHEPSRLFRRAFAWCYFFI